MNSLITNSKIIQSKINTKLSLSVQQCQIHKKNPYWNKFTNPYQTSYIRLI